MKAGDLVRQKWQVALGEFSVGIIVCFSDLYLVDVLFEEGELWRLHVSELEVVNDRK